MENPSTPHSRTLPSTQFKEKLISGKQNIHTNLGSSEGLIQTITMDLLPDRDNFLPLKTSDLKTDYERRPLSYSFESALPIIHHGFVGNDEHSHFVDDANHLQGLSQHKPYDGQWQQRLHSDIGDKISPQYVL